MAAKQAQVVIKPVQPGNQKGTYQMSFVAKNGKQIVSTEAYVSRNVAIRAWDIIEMAIRNGTYGIDADCAGTFKGFDVAPHPYVELYEVEEGNSKGTNAMRFRAANHRIIIHSEGYKNADDALRAWDLIEDAVLRCDFVIRLR